MLWLPLPLPLPLPLLLILILMLPLPLTLSPSLRQPQRRHRTGAAPDRGETVGATKKPPA